MIKLISFDLDGTLVRSDNTIAPSSLEALKKARKKGAQVTVCTGRSFDFAKNVVDTLGMDDPIICCNGALVQDSETTHIGYPIRPSDVVRIIGIVEEAGIMAALFDDRLLYAKDDDVSRDEIRRWCSISDLDPEYPGIRYYDSYREIWEAIGDCYKILLLEYDEKRHAALLERLRREVSAEAVVPEAGHIDIAQSGVSKGKALSDMAAGLGLDRSEVMAFGDAENDLGMIEFAGTGVAMGNAMECVKKAADYITGDHDADGIASALSHFGLC